MSNKQTHSPRIILLKGVVSFLLGLDTEYPRILMSSLLRFLLLPNKRFTLEHSLTSFQLQHHEVVEKNIMIFISLFFKFIYFLFLAALGLRCYALAFSSCSEWGLLFIAVCRLIVVASPVAEHRL